MLQDYKFYIHIKPDIFIWSTTLQTRVKFEDDVWLAVTSEHTVTGVDGELYYGNIMTNTTSFGKNYPVKNVEFEISSTNCLGNKIEKFENIPTNSKFFYMDFKF